LGGFTAVHQFCRIGPHVMLGGGSIVLADVPPYVMANGNSAEPRGINSEGLKRRGFAPGAINAIRRAFKTLYKSNLLLDDARKAIADDAKVHPELAPLSDFLAVQGRGISR